MKITVLGKAVRFRNNYLALVLSLFLYQSSQAQVYTANAGYGFTYKGLNADSTFSIPTFCGVPSLRTNKTNKAALAFDSCAHRLWFYDPKTMAWDTIKGGSGGSITRPELIDSLLHYVTNFFRTGLNWYVVIGGLPYLAGTDSVGITDTSHLSDRIDLKQNLVTLTTTGTSGASTFNQSTGALNIPQYTGGGGSYTDSLTQIGIVYSKKSWANLNDFTDLGTGATISGTGINITGGTNVFTDNLFLKDTVLYDSYKMKIRFRISGTPTTNDAIGIGVRALSSTLSLIVKGDFSNGGNAGKLLFYTGTGTLATTLVNGSAISFTTGDTAEIIFDKREKYLSASLTNLNNISSPYTVEYTYPVSTTPNIPSSGNFSIWRFGGNYDINALSVYSNDRKYSPIGFIGDSKTQLYSATEIYNAYPYLIRTYINNGESNISSINNYAGGSDRVSTALIRLPQILAAKPSLVFIAIGCNDIRDGKTPAQVMTNMRSLTGQLTSAGIDYVQLLPFPENAINLQPLVDSIVAQYPNKYIDTWNPLRTGTGLNAAYNSGDGVHPNNAGHLLIARQIIKSGYVDGFNKFKSLEKLDVPIGFGGGNVSNNVSVGRNSLFSNTTGSGNTSNGFQALKSNTTGLDLTAVGFQALTANTTGSYSTSVGYQSMLSNTSGAYNSAFGFSALKTNIIGGNNAAFGSFSLRDNTAGNNTGFGYATLLTNTTGQYNVAVGTEALSTNTTANSSTALGYRALKSSTASNNTGVGYMALTALTTGSSNTAIGDNAGAALTTQNNNVYIGHNNSYRNTGIENVSIGSNIFGGVGAGSYCISIGSNNTLSTNATGNINFAIGKGAIANNSIGNNNLGLGINSLNISTGDNNLGLGHYSGAYSTQSNSIFINNRDRLNMLGDSTLSPIYIEQAATTTAQKIYLNGNVSISNKLNIASGANLSLNTTTLSSGTVTISNTSVTASSKIWVQYYGAPSTVSSILTVPTITAGTSFVVTALTPGTVTTATTDNNVIQYWITN